ncbi:MAG: T9SS type A sorting domain-containing protein [Bacteroidales bacterium]
MNFDYEPISVGKNVKQDDIKVFYSSSNRILFVKTASLEQIQVELFDINGKKTGFWLVNSNNNSITIDNLSQGVYLCRVVTKDLAPFVTKIFIE